MLSSGTTSLLLGLWPTISQAVPLTIRSGGSDPFAVLDPQNWVAPENMTWADYKYPPNTSWNNPNRTGSERNFNIALVCVDFQDLNFTVTQRSNSTIWSNPMPISSNIDREDVPTYYRDLLNKPEEINRGHTLHEYWMEDSAGKYGVDLTTFGAYRLPLKFFQYGIDSEEDGFNEGYCPEEPCSVSLRDDALGAWREDIGNSTADSYELAFILVAGQDESSTWQEFGEMLFDGRDEVPEEWGPPEGSSLPNWAKTRYIEWTSWAAAAGIWPNAGDGSSTQAESSGMSTFAHELSHLLGIYDNYNNPYGDPPRRSYSGPWSMLSRGTFNGPGGPHSRWQIPALQGSSLGSHHTVRDKLQLDLIDNSSVLDVTRETLGVSGILVAELTARAVVEGEDGLKGVRIEMGMDLSPACNTTLDALCDGRNYTDYYMEVIDRVGADSFTPDSGVMLSKTKVSDEIPPFQWTIDANPQDINVVDFYRPNGTASYYSIGDYRQLSDALFHAGTRSGSEFEYVDEANGLHFYVIDLHRDEQDVLKYTVGARALGHFGPSTIGLGMMEGHAKEGSTMDEGVECTFELRNAGSYSAGNASSAISEYMHSDIVRLAAEVDGEGWEVAVPNALTAIEFGESKNVSVAVRACGDASSDATVKLTALSESSEHIEVTQTCEVRKC